MIRRLDGNRYWWCRCFFFLFLYERQAVQRLEKLATVIEWSLACVESRAAAAPVQRNHQRVYVRERRVGKKKGQAEYELLLLLLLVDAIFLPEWRQRGCGLLNRGGGSDASWFCFCRARPGSQNRPIIDFSSSLFFPSPTTLSFFLPFHIYLLNSLLSSSCFSAVLAQGLGSRVFSVSRSLHRSPVRFCHNSPAPPAFWSYFSF